MGKNRNGYNESGSRHGLWYGTYDWDEEIFLFDSSQYIFSKTLYDNGFFVNNIVEFYSDSDEFLGLKYEFFTLNKVGFQTRIVKHIEEIY